MNGFRVLISLAGAAALSAACSDDVGIEDNEPARNAGVQPEGNGTAIDEEEACSAIRDAVESRAQALNCQGISVACPGYIRPAGGDACLQYDEGTVQECRDFIGKYSSCGDFSTKPCVVSTIPGSMSANCSAPIPDAGGDGPGPDATPDATPDAMPDAGPDTAADAPPDNAMDAPGDTNGDAATDGAADAATG